MKSRFVKLCSILLVIAMLVNMLPMQALAREAQNNSSAPADAQADSHITQVLGEVESLREEGIKHFRLSDGSSVAVSYGMPVHFQNDAGQWMDIDNSLSLAAGAYRTANPAAPAAFSSTLADGKLFTVEHDGHAISMSLLDTAAAERMISGGLDAEKESIPEETEAVTAAPAEGPQETAGASEQETSAPDISEEDPGENTQETTGERVEEGEKSASGNGEVDPPSEDTTEETEPQEAQAETAASEAAETEPAAAEPSETEAQETVPSETLPAETVSRETEAAEREEAVSAVKGLLTFDREAIAEVVEDTPTMLNLQEKYSWDINDIIPEKLQSSVLYRDVFPGIDLQYTTFGYNIKEQIVVNEPQESYRFDFLLKCGSLTAVLNENGSVSFFDSDDTVVCQIPIPCMDDGAGLSSYDVHYALQETDQGIVLTVEADADWINDEDRVFPVMIDPSFIIVSGKALDEIYSTFTMEAAPNTNTLGRQYLYVGAQPGSKTNDGRYRLFMHFQNMPTIPAGSEVVDAQLNLYQFEYNQRYCPSFPIGVYEVTTSLPSAYSSYYNWFTKMTWRTAMPSYDTTNCIDYVMVDATKGYRTWNMTELVKKWYAEGTSNTTAALVMMNEDAIDYNYFYGSAGFYAYAGVHPPVLAVSYRNNTGIEPYYTYATLGAGDAGTAYISDHTGQLKIAKELVGYASSTNPFSLNLVYNSDYFSRSGSDFCPPANLGLSMNVGSGWTLDCIQRITAETISDVAYLKYTDGDGTIHYFCKDSSKDSSYYYDEDGLGLKIKNTGTNAYTMSDDKGNEWIFTGSYLTSIKDSDGNAINISYSGGRITSISQTNKGQSSITVASFTYSGNQLTAVTDAAGNTYTLTYSGTKLVSIQRGSTETASYEYSGYRAAKMTDSKSGYGIAFTYANGKVASYQEKSGSAAGAAVTVTYPNHTQTVYRDHGADRTANTADDILTYYLFDYAGRTANAYTTDNAGNVLGATNAVYSGSGSTDKTNNRTLRSASIGIAGQQLLRDTSLESTAQWTISGASISVAKPRTGSFSVEGTLEGSGTQSVYRSSESLAAGTTYTFSGYVNTSEVTSFAGSGVYLKVTDGSGNTWTSNPVNYATANTVDDGWVRVSVSFTAESSGAHTVGVYIDGAVGSCYADDFQLEKGEAPSSHNLVENGSMQMSSHGWTMGTGASIDTSRGAAGSSASLKISGDPESTSTNAYQDIPLNLPGSQTYVLSGWAYANAVPDSNPGSATGTSKKCGLRATITYSGGGTEAHYASFNSDLSKNWQFTSLTIVPKQPEKTVASIRVTCAYEGNANVAYFDNISLLREAAQSMKYDANGNLVSVNSPGLKEDTSTYSGGNLIKTVTGGNGTYTYTYDTTYTHRLKSVSNGEITQSMGYDGTGNVTSTTLSGSGGKTISTSATYTGNGNRLESVTDTAGATVSYGYGTAASQMLGLPTSVTDSYGTVTASSYDASGRVTQTGIADTANLLYTYSSGNLSSVKRTDSSNSAQTYGFTYDAFGNMLTAKVGSRTLVTNTYGTGNGLLTKQTYGNGDSVSYTYDNLGRVKTTSYPDWSVFTYCYNGEGRLHSAEQNDQNNIYTYLYNYDSLGRLISSEKLMDGAPILQESQTYNSNNQLTSTGWRVDGESFSEQYTYNASDGSLNTITMSSGDTLTMGYDGLRRLSSMSGGLGARSYSYNDKTASATTLQVKSITYPELGNLTFTYTYDSNGNIATYTAPGKGTITYTYDDMGQLTGATGGEGYSYSYGYDDVGNITSISDPFVDTVLPYESGDWKDLISEYVTYDEIGNPLFYMNGISWMDLTWRAGRLLASADAGDGTIFFAYDINGLRTAKMTYGTTYEYVYSGDKLLRQTWETTDDGEFWSFNSIDFFYDGNGTPYAMKYNGEMYYYVTNLQGDVIMIVDSTGETVAEYEYSPYGKVLYSAGELSYINPLRYRGYVYDEETGFYYLQSRYYDPQLGRFINADSVDNLGADPSLMTLNLFNYCANNPVNRYDASGNLSLPNWAKVAIGVGVIAVAAAVTVATGGAAAGTLLAAVNCAAHGALVGSITQGVVGAVTGAVSGAVTHRLKTGSWTGAEKAAIDGAATGFMTGTITGAITGAVSSPYCFVAGTTVLTAAGATAIETIQAGDMVWAWDEETGDVALKPVVETYVNETDELVHIHVNGEEIVCTPAHPFYSPVKGWTDAVHLRAGDILVLVNGEYVVVEKVQHEILESPIKVYNFQVEDYHTYYVTNNGILVHNTCTQRAAMREAKRSVNIPMSENPTSVEYVKMIGSKGRTVFAKLEIFGNKFIRNDVGGHLFSDGAVLPRHFNAGIIDEVGRFVQNGMHFWY